MRCDASPSGVGAILFHKGRPWKYWADTITDEDLAFLKAERKPEWQPEFELLGIVVSLKIWASLLELQSVTIHGGALAALYAADKFSSKSPAMNFIAGELGLLVEAKSVHITCKRVPESVNLDADALSRLAEGRALPRSLLGVDHVPAPVRDESSYMQKR